MADSVDVEELLRRVREQQWGAHPGRVAAQLHTVYATATDDRTRARVAAALVRSWVYGGEADRATRFAAEAVDLAERIADPAILADALEAALLATWGPDQLAERRAITERLSDVAAHLDDVHARMMASMWRLTVSLESLDGLAVARQLRVLDSLAIETDSPLVRFFADSRGAVHALVTGDVDTARRLAETALRSGAAAEVVDLEAVTHCLHAGLAVQTSDTAALADEAAQHCEHGLATGVPIIAAVGSNLFCYAGDLARAGTVLDRLTTDTIPDLARDVDWLPTVALLVWTATKVGRTDLLDRGIGLLAPYSGRAIIDAGAVMFHGVVSDVLYRASAALGRTDDAARYRAAAADEYRRLGAVWWLERLGEPTVQRSALSRVVHLRATGGDLWIVGYDGSSCVLRDSKGLRYLRELVGNAGKEISALDLTAVVEGHSGTALVDSDAGEVLDAAAKSAYRRRLADLDEEIAEASAWSDTERAARLELERDALLDQLAAAAGLGGRGRVALSNSERARVAVRKAISAALDRIAQQDPTFARLLRDAVRTGRVCSFEPDPSRPIEWRLS
ncbi:hypothetical protein [Antrihabitans stalactiti]|uniref:Uncharacterized protein n=1 Tax=Antrihabitans stalactiti TaxID=2584121 RepID=A0A848KFX6_9NOCA|nr:hypothetical protein [Antrihabitans stalactiti]NMN95612.1 hypothetical protein [Antrihabitans stalactiti]